MAHDRIAMRITAIKSKNRASKGSKFEQLFEDAKRRHVQENKRGKMVPDSECTFSPNIELTQEFNLIELGQRQLIDRREERERKRKAEKVEPPPTREVDAQTGQLLFTPTIGRSPKRRSKSKCESIGEYLYKARCGESPERGLERSSDTTQSVSLVHGRSSHLVEKMRRDCFVSLFSLLDSDGDGTISSSAINVSGMISLTKRVGLPSEICEMYLPVFHEMEAMKCTLSQEEFVDASNNLFKELSVSQRSDLITFHKSLGGSHSSRSLSSCEAYSFKVQQSCFIANE